MGKAIKEETVFKAQRNHRAQVKKEEQKHQQIISEIEEKVIKEEKVI